MGYMIYCVEDFYSRFIEVCGYWILGGEEGFVRLFLWFEQNWMFGGFVNLSLYCLIIYQDIVLCYDGVVYFRLEVRFVYVEDSGLVCRLEVCFIYIEGFLVFMLYYWVEFICLQFVGCFYIVRGIVDVCLVVFMDIVRYDSWFDEDMNQFMDCL